MAGQKDGLTELTPNSLKPVALGDCSFLNAD